MQFILSENKSKADKQQLTAIVPMKGHSERVNNKNVRSFQGKPLFYYIIETLQKCPVVSRVCVDTDSIEICDGINKVFENIEIIKRPTELCGDYVSMNKIIEYDISVINGKGFYIQTHATNPLLTSETICKAYDFFLKKHEVEGADSLFSVNRLQTRLYDEECNPINHKKNELIRTQDLNPIFEENSNIYIFSRDSFLKNNSRIGNSPIMFEMNQIESIDIDTEDQFKLAEHLYRMRQEG